MSAKALEDVEGALGGELPEDYREFLREQNGGEPEGNVFDVPGAGTRAGVRMLFGITGEENDDDLLHEQRLLRGRLPDRVIAIGNASCGNAVCLSLRKEDFGKVLFWDHELESDEDAALFELAGSFGAFLASLRKHNLGAIQLQPGQVQQAWIDPEFLKNIERNQD